MPKLHNPLPESIDVSCRKAASILDHFIKGTNELDHKLIPQSVLKNAAGIAILTIVKAGMLWSGRAGTGLVVARLDDGSWSAPSAICCAGVGVGAQIGAQITDVVFVLNTKNAVRAFSHGNFTVGGNISVAAGPTGRSTEAGGAIMHAAPIYSYSKSKGLFIGVTLEGTVILTRKKANAKMYGSNIKAADILSGSVAKPAAAEPLYRMLMIKFGHLGHGPGSDPRSVEGSDPRLKHEDPRSLPSLPEKPARSLTQASNTTSLPAPSPKMAPKIGSKPKKAVALYDYQSTIEGDLSFRKGDSVWISKENGEWFEGTMGSHKGTFPSSCNLLTKFRRVSSLISNTPIYINSLLICNSLRQSQITF